MSHEVGKKKTRKQQMKHSKPEEIHNDEIKKHTTSGLVRGER
ncbi:hypothetical protein CPAST_c15270 [Clostridium pasteurianum DSM 525 = ATCC 6013]|uniref:Uncharacterized protein n=1 Tax=Clostridium pasteurianum DSM 525 = ATCC 6013 TaxID=1262449 RepID=A0A0H3J405_CLOPA|nr:hypothetical protein [Clostridium pasteurianum]AJA47602.1 hypothetical protein CPAST_c15270 [Clostridium pasteurianum DSM 525 = ATCC 6013]AJA51590.1 hypothetical protein CLPA_c15270 [Clostridium pasteurianum DSM 525 = ATCC 6013]KRU12403.1 hypothetical protein CP6013_01650 [Clostridium pasteurianum DSM 525 = ATCC 6013]UZW15774.1 hypothetical protein OSC52_08130 [Clostridium pasteurianum]